MESTYPSFTPTYHHEPYPLIDPTQPHLSCKGLTILITGAGSGIGQAITVAFAEAHARGIILLGRTEATLHETASLSRTASNGNTEPLIAVADITDAAAVNAALEKAKTHFGDAPDVLVNNAGGMLARGAIADIDLEGFAKTMALNVQGPLTVTQAFIRSATTSSTSTISTTSTAETDPKERTIIFIPSGVAHIPYAPGAVAYAASKTACAKLAEYTHHEHPAWRVFNLQPGVVATALARGAARAAEDEAELPARMAVWLVRDARAKELNGRFLWANWDLEEVLERKEEIQRMDLLTLGLEGWADGYTAQDLMARARRVSGNANKKE